MIMAPAAEPTTPASARRTILFVLTDDPERARMVEALADMRLKWEAECTEDPQVARARIQAGSLDAILVDLLAFATVGADLLKQAMEVSPNTLRLGLSATSERQAIEQLGAPAQQLLSKPCEPKVLMAVLARAFASREYVSQDEFRRLLAGITSLPVLPEIYAELMEELKSEDPSLERAGQIVAKDMGLTAKILQLVNSAFFGLGRPIAHPSEAAMFLGSETLEALVLSLQVFSQFQHLRLNEFNVENLWKHSWTVGVLSKRLCELEEAKRATTDEAFISGLLHDVGKLVLAANYPERLEQNLRIARQQSMPLWEQETRTWGVSHAELGGHLLGLWGLPPGVVEAVACHHRPAQAIQQTFSALTAVHVANTLGQLHSNHCNTPPQIVDLDYLRSLGLANRVDGWKQFFLEAAARR